MTRLHRHRLNAADRALFFRQLQMLLGAGVLLSDALRCLAQRFPEKAPRRVIARIHLEVVQSRRPFSAALAQFPRSFPPRDIALVVAGEGGGSSQLAERLGDLADRVQFEQAHRSQLRRACAYPIAALGLAGGLGSFLATVVVPRVEELLHSLGGRLPPLTLAVLAAVRAGREHGLAALAGLAAAVAALLACHRSTRFVRHCDRWFWRLPLVGPIHREFAVALFCKVYRSLYLSNLPAPSILEACVPLTRNECYRGAVRAARAQVVHQGTGLSQALDGTRLFPPLAILAIEVGEQSGRLAEAMEEVSRHFHAQARRRLDAALGLLGPSLTVAVVSGVGLLMVGFFQALYQIVYASR